MTPAQRQANYRKRQEEKMRRYEYALRSIMRIPPTHPSAVFAITMANVALDPPGATEASNDILG